MVRPKREVPPWRSLVLRFPRLFPWWMVLEQRRALLIAAYQPDFRDANDSRERHFFQGQLDHELQMLQQEAEIHQTTKLRTQAQRLMVPLPSREGEDGGDFWYLAVHYGEWVLTRAGIKLVREEIRAEKKARTEAATRWVSYISAIATCLALVTAVLALRS